MDQGGVYTLGKISNKYLIFDILNFACFDNLAPYHLLHRLTRRFRALSLDLYSHLQEPPSPLYLTFNLQSVPIYPSYDPYTLYFQSVDSFSVLQVIDTLLQR
jgi:hypothetical protein